MGDPGGLLQRGGFALPVSDVERLTVRYRDFSGLARDLRAHGMTNVLSERSRKSLRRDTLAALLAAGPSLAATLKATLLFPADDARLERSRAERAYLEPPEEQGHWLNCPKCGTVTEPCEDEDCDERYDHDGGLCLTCQREAENAD